MPACAKTPPAAQSAPAAAAEGAAPAAAGTDTALPPGLDVSKLDDFQKKVFFRIVNAEPSICGQAQSLIASAKKDCRRSFNAMRYVGKLVEQGFTDSEVSEALGKRYRVTEPKQIDVSEAPMKGSPSAKVTLVEFADYECPHCKRLQPVLRQIVDEYHNDVKVYFKHYPLPQHTNARLAAEAAVAANKQGKFWAYQDKLWDKQDELSPAEIEKIAKETGLDVAKFRADLASAAVKDRVQKDRAEGQALGLQATPTLYIDGREYTDPKDVESLREWINEELGK
ncbi:MAG TPA: thioredoxin domain-containing protein [Polyangia bacterium]|nr:thioredoxin domain-containing protein [Polyangia bacterium]